MKAAEVADLKLWFEILSMPGPCSCDAEFEGMLLNSWGGEVSQDLKWIYTLLCHI